MHFKQLIGKTGEQLACEYLLKNNHIIVQKNFYCYQGEIDIIAKDLISNELVFVEVKTRRNYKFGCPVDGIDYNKRSHLLKSCQYYLYKNSINDISVRIDVIEVFINHNSFKINHLKQVF